MIVHIRLFALARELCGAELIEVPVPLAARVADLRAALASAYPALSPLAGSAMFAFDAAYVSEDFPLVEGSEMACILPVSGG